MSTFMLYHRRSAPTGEAIARALGVAHGTQDDGTSLDVIRWGSRVELRGYRRVLNSAAAIGRASDKLLTLQILEDAGVRIPNFSENPEQLTIPFLGRRRHHARGTDVVLCLQRGDWRRNARDYYVEYIPTTREYRLHVANGEVFRVQGKYADDRRLAATTPWIRNYGSGYRFRAPRKRLRQGRLDLAVEAVRALGLDFGAVDLVISNSGEAYVLEVNTAPACSPLTAAGYVAAFKQALEIPDEQVHLEILDILSPEQDDGDTDDWVEGEDEL